MRIIIIVMLLISSTQAFSQNKRYKSRDSRYHQLVIAPIIGGGAMPSISSTGEYGLAVEYILGGNIEVRPRREFEIETSLTYNRVFYGQEKGFHYSTLNLFYNRYVIDNLALMAGSMFYLNHDYNRITLKDSKIGIAGGAKFKFQELILFVMSGHPLMKVPENQLSLVAGMIVKFRLPIVKCCKSSK